MDGVIVDSEPCHERAFLDIVRRIGYGDNHGLIVSDYIGRSDQELWAAFVKRNKPLQTLEELLAMKRARVVELLLTEQPLFEGLLQLLEKLAPRYRIALASGSERAVVEAVLTLKGLRRFFAVTVTGSDIVHGKPAPDIFLRASELLGVASQNCWVIEDSKPGIAAALAAGMRVIAITNTYPAGELGAATHVVETYDRIAELMCREAQ
jgi:HAD superfamily hydrolase (TIGR01509 family)